MPDLVRHKPLSNASRKRRRNLVKTIAFAVIWPVFLLTLAWLALEWVGHVNLGLALESGWWIVVAAFTAGGLTVFLPRKFPVFGAILMILFFEFLATFMSTQFRGIVMFCAVMAGFTFGFALRSLWYQRRHWNDAGPAKSHR